jgi:exodeoxyribonuclease VIII
MTTVSEQVFDATNPKPGFFPRVPSPIYHALDAASCSRLKKLYQKSPAHCLYAMKHPPKQTEQMRLGSLLHMAILEPELFASTCEYAPYFGDGRTKKAQEAKETWCSEHRGKEAICVSDNADKLLDGDKLKGMIAALRASPGAWELLSAPGYSEASFLWNDPDTGILCKSRADRYLTRNHLIDIKTCATADVIGFGKSAASLLYHMQAAMYVEAVGYVTGEIGTDFTFIAVENEPPYGIQVFPVEKPVMERGRALYRELLTEYAECKSNNHWPSYPAEPCALTLPAWAMSDGEEDGEPVTFGGVAIF